MNIDTIKDFDIGVGGSNEVERLSDVPTDVSRSEVTLALWLILEHHLGNVDANALKKAASAKEKEEDHVDSKNKEDENFGNVGSPPEDILSDLQLTDRQRRRTMSRSSKARKDAEELLHTAGIQMPFYKMTIAERKNIYNQFARSTALLRNRNIGSISELFTVLRAESKLSKEYEVGQRLGRGNFGDVYSVVNRDSRVVYAAKRISLSLDSFEEMKMTLNESKIMKNLHHENIVQFKDAWLELQYDPKHSKEENSEQEPLKFYVLMDICHESLRQYVEDSTCPKPDQSQIVIVLKHTISALKFIHSRQILHLDINSRNIMWADKQRTLIKIGDFGLAIKGESYPYPTGTYPYSASDGVCTNKSDIYSLGVTLLEVAEKIVTTQELIERLNEHAFLTDFPFLNNALLKILTPNPNTRPSAEEFEQMLKRIFQPPVRPQLELTPADYKLLKESYSSTSDEGDQQNGHCGKEI